MRIREQLWQWASAAPGYELGAVTHIELRCVRAAEVRLYARGYKLAYYIYGSIVAISCTWSSYLLYWESNKVFFLNGNSAQKKYSRYQELLNLRLQARHYEAGRFSLRKKPSQTWTCAGRACMHVQSGQAQRVRSWTLHDSIVMQILSDCKNNCQDKIHTTKPVSTLEIYCTCVSFLFPAQFHH